MASPSISTTVIRVNIDHKKLPSLETSSLSLLYRKRGTKEFMPFLSGHKFTQTEQRTVHNLLVFPQEKKCDFTVKFYFACERVRASKQVTTIVEQCLDLSLERPQPQLTFNVGLSYQDERYHLEVARVEEERPQEELSAAEEATFVDLKGNRSGAVSPDDWTEVSKTGEIVEQWDTWIEVDEDLVP